MWQIISSAMQITYLLLKNKFEKDELEKKRKEGIYVEFKEALKNLDSAAIDSVFRKLSNN